MKKTLLTSLLLASSLLANVSLDKVKQNVYETLNTQLQKTPNSSVKINYIEKDDKLGNYVGVNTITFNGRKQVGMFLAFNEGKVIMPFTQNTVLIQKDGIYMDSVLISMSAKSVQLQKKLKKENDKKLKDKFLKHISLKDKPIILSKGHKQTVVVFLDPNCPYCVQKLHNTKEWEEVTQKNNVIVILTPLVRFDENGKLLQAQSLHPYSPYYSAAILSNLKNKKTLKEKLEILQKYSKTISRNNKEWKNLKYDKKDLEVSLNNSKKYFNKVGITGTPAFFILNSKETEKLFKILK